MNSILIHIKNADRYLLSSYSDVSANLVYTQCMANWINTFILLKKNSAKTPRQPIQNYSGNILKEGKEQFSIPLNNGQWSE